jgi:hypothetical protein
MTRGDVPSGKGQCDIRLQVDDQAEVSVHGDTVSLHTVSGREARDDGSECNLPLPNREIRGFTFEVKDSRGDIRLVQEPGARNNFTAIVGIRDTGSRDGRYHFRLSWLTGDSSPPPDRPGPAIDDRHSSDSFAWNNVIHYGGRGAGSSVYNDADPRRLSDASLDIDRAGHAKVTFRGERKSTVTLTGMVIGRDGDRLKIDIVTEDRRLHGTLYVSINDRLDTIRSMDMEATDGHDRMRVHWDRR